MFYRSILPWFSRKKPPKTDKPVSELYTVIDNDLARDNMENDLPLADQEDLQAHND